MIRRTRGYRKPPEQENFWPSFADVMSTIALVMLFLVMIVFIKNIIVSISLDDERDKLTATRLDLETKEAILVIAEQELEEKERLIAVFEEQLINLTDLLSRAEQDMSDKQQIIIILAEQRAQLENIIAINTRELQDLRLTLQSISVLQASIFQRVKQSIEATMGRYNERGEELVIIGDNANLYINESLVFDFGSAAVKPVGFELLRQLSFAFEKILDDAEIRKYIDAISVEGHTDYIGTTFDNRRLSTERSTNVLNFIMSSNPSLERKYGSYFSASGFSELRPIATNLTEGGRALNRRIEFSIKIRDDNVQQVIEDYLRTTRGAN